MDGKSTGTGTLARLGGVGAVLALIMSACGTSGGSPAATATALPSTASPSSIGSISTLPANATFEQTLPYFAYDTSLPLDIKDTNPPKTQDGVTVRDITYAATPGVRVPAYLVVPAGAGPFAATLFLHAEGAGGLSRTQFLDEAISLAGHGVVSLLPSRIFPGVPVPEDWRIDRESVVRQVTQLRRGLDLLGAQPGVDSKRIGFVGHDYGGMSGAVLAAVDHRIKASVYISFNGTWSEWFFLNYNIDEAVKPEYLTAMTAVDPGTAIAHVAAMPVFLQWGENDGFCSPEMRNKVITADPQAKVTVYANGAWDVAVPTAAPDREAWLSEQLGLTR